MSEDGAVINVERGLLERALASLRAALTRSTRFARSGQARGHLAQRVTTEGLGFCGWRSESPRCVEHRALVAELEAALGERREGA